MYAPQHWQSTNMLTNWGQRGTKKAGEEAEVLGQGWWGGTCWSGSEVEGENPALSSQRGTKRLTQAARWENRVLENFLVSDAYPRVHRYTLTSVSVWVRQVPAGDTWRVVGHRDLEGGFIWTFIGHFSMLINLTGKFNLAGNWSYKHFTILLLVVLVLFGICKTNCQCAGPDQDSTSPGQTLFWTLM